MWGGGSFETFKGELLVQQEPDASSFPNGGLRNTFEARGYSAWDPSSPAFILDKTLCIPSIFIAYTGEALDFKTPLLKSLTAVDKAAVEVCQYFDKDVDKVNVTLGWEQEYFLVDEALFLARPDLMQTGRTLMGHIAAKDQQLDDHYFGAIPDRVLEFMKDFEQQAYRLGIPLKTRHNEVAPNQFECAPMFEEANIARRPQHAADDHHATRRTQAQTESAVPRKAVSGRQRIGQALQLVAVHEYGRQSAGPGQDSEE